MIYLYDQWGWIDIDKAGPGIAILFGIVGLVSLVVWLTRKR